MRMNRDKGGGDNNTALVRAKAGVQSKVTAKGNEIRATAKDRVMTRIISHPAAVGSTRAIRTNTTIHAAAAVEAAVMVQMKTNTTDSPLARIMKMKDGDSAGAVLMMKKINLNHAAAMAARVTVPPVTNKATKANLVADVAIKVVPVPRMNINLPTAAHAAVRGDRVIGAKTTKITKARNQVRAAASVRPARKPNAARLRAAGAPVVTTGELNDYKELLRSHPGVILFYLGQHLSGLI